MESDYRMHMSGTQRMKAITLSRGAAASNTLNLGSQDVRSGCLRFCLDRSYTAETTEVLSFSVSLIEMLRLQCPSA